MNGPELLEALGDNASLWATAFCQIAKTHNLDIDEDWMTTWFANAIEHAEHTRRIRQGRL
jgi:hypothetical protein